MRHSWYMYLNLPYNIYLFIGLILDKNVMICTPMMNIRKSMPMLVYDFYLLNFFTRNRLLSILIIYFWLRYIFVYQKFLKQTFQTSFWGQNHLLNLCSRVVNSQRFIFVVKKLVWNVRIKAFWYTKTMN